jgi:proline dehydrogenase
MPLWQRTMVALARSERLEHFMHSSVLFNRLAGQFVGGADAEAAVAKTRALQGEGLRASLYYLGEYVTDPARVEENVQRKLEIVRALAAAGLDVHVSVDPTQIGYSRSDELGAANALCIAREIGARAGAPTAERRHGLMLDMEDSSFVERTLDLHARLRGQRLPTAITIQAYLRRSEADIERLAAQGAHLRLVKGAFAEPRSRAWTRRAEIDRSYLYLTERLLSPEALANGCYPAFGTHDERMIEAVLALAERNGWARGRYELEMLYGVRRPLQAALAKAGLRLRIYVPFGHAWWPYTLRRIGENPSNLRFVLRAMLRRG